MIHKNSHLDEALEDEEISRKLPPFHISISSILSRFKCTNFFRLNLSASSSSHRFAAEVK